MRTRSFDAAPVDPAIEGVEHDDYRARTPPGAQKRAVRVACRRAHYELDDLRRAIDDARPDALLGDVNAWGRWPSPRPGAARGLRGVPIRCRCPHARHRHTGPASAPARAPVGRLRDAALGPIVFGSLERIVAPGVNEVRERVGVPPLSGAVDLFGVPPLLLCLTAEPFEYPRSD